MNKTQEALNEGEQIKNNAAMEDHWGNNPRFKKALADSALDRMAENARNLGLDYAPIVERVENSVGMGHGAWDMVEPKELAKGFHEAFAEQPAQQQEPVAIADGTFNHNCPIGTPLYTSPPASKPWVGLTESEIKKLCHLIEWTAGWSYIKFARAIEAKLKEKNNE